jgi:peptidoglycan/xylan/chitin deacetylase (PgdA/CDA1 family)
MPIHLPEGKKCAVCLTFDFDAISVWLGAFGVSTPASVARGEYGARVGAPRLLSLLDKYEIKTTWFIPGHTVDTYPELIREINRRGHEIAHHGYSHKTPVEVDQAEELRELLKGMESIKSAIGKYPQGYRSPAWDISTNTINLLRDHNFKYDSSLMADDYTPYKCRIGDKPFIDKAFEFGKEVNMIEFPPSWSLCDWEHFEYTLLPSSVWPGLRAASGVLENWQADFEYMYQYVPSGVFTLTMHPQVIGRGHRMMMLESFVRKMTSTPGTYFARLIDLANSWKD